MDLVITLASIAVLVLSAVVLLYQHWPAFRYHARFTFFTLIMMVCASAPIPLMMLRPRDPRNALMPAWGARVTSRLLGLSWQVRGTENAPKDRGCVVLLNHQSAIDMFVLAYLWPRLSNCAVVSKKEVLYLGPFGLATWLWGTIFIDRLNPERARNTVDKTARAMKEQKKKLLMFPEGTRSNGTELLPFKKGAFHVAIAAQAPLLPVVVSRYYFLDSKKKIFDHGRSIISILPPIETTGMSRDDLETLVEKTRAVMQAEHTRLSAETAAWAKTSNNSANGVASSALGH